MESTGHEQAQTRCWYTRTSMHVPVDFSGLTIEDGCVVFCAHPMMFPVVGYHFDIRNCDSCEYYRPVKVQRPR